MRVLLETNDLQICLYDENDANVLASVLMDKQTMRFWPAPFTYDKVEMWITQAMQSYSDNGIGRMGIVEKSSGELIGDCGIIYAEFNAEWCWDLGIIVAYAYEARGYAAQALRVLISYCFKDLQIPALRVHTPVDHAVVRWLSEKAGFQLLKIYKNSKNRDIETCVYELKNTYL